jgi:uncharacterized membrane protein YedE/YeeE
MNIGPLAIFDVISPETNFFFATLLGIAFGFVLESAGFGNSRRLAGVFYGYDMLVLKVFFTAAITAMVGLLIFSILGWIDLSLIYINPLFTQSTIVGGLIMGLGFILGGYCPGTSLCSAATGKLDGIWFVVGLFIGIFLFVEAYPLIKGIYKANPQGGVKLSDMLGISDGIFALGMVIVALGAFWFAEWVEKRVNTAK